MKNLSIKALAALGFAFTAFASFNSQAATRTPHADAPGIRVCNPDGTCSNSNGPSLDGLVEGDQVPKLAAGRKPAAGIRLCMPDEQHTCDTTNGPSLDGFVEGDQVPKHAAGRKPAAGIRLCMPDEEHTCDTVNGPSLDGFTADGSKTTRIKRLHVYRG